MRDLILDPYLRNAVLNLLMDGTLIWVTAAVIRQHVRWYRILSASLAGALYGLWTQLARDGILPGWDFLSSPLIVLLALPVVMLLTAFLPTTRRRFLRLAAVFVLFALGSYGLANALYYLLLQRGQAFNPYLFFLFEAGLALVVAEIGWGAVHEHAVARVCQVPLVFHVGQTSLETTGYLDTANHLRDPLTHRPVIVVDYTVLRDVLTVEARAFVEAMAEDSVPPPVPIDDPWLPRLRIIPFSTVQRRNGLMPALRLDRVRLGTGSRGLTHTSIVVGLELAGGFFAGCRALVPPSLWWPEP